MVLQVTWLPPAEEDIMTRLNNTLTMQTSTSYEQIPSFHNQVCVAGTKVFHLTKTQHL